MAHHDAISGTSKQQVTDDYVRKIFEASNLINTETSQIISKVAHDLAGIKSIDGWDWCLKNKETYH
jgi:glycerol-3-phosphate responsive antiterminator